MKKIYPVIFLLTAALIISIPSLTYPETVTHTYDDLNRLIRSEYSDGTTLIYDYDKLGNRTLKKKLYKPHNLTIEKTGAGSGTIVSTPARISCGSKCSELFSEGIPITLTATPDPGSLFIQWSGGGCSGSDPCVLNVTADTTVAGLFQTCSSLPLRIVGAGYYSSIQEAYNAATDGAVIQAQDVTIMENLTADQNRTVTLAGGYSCDYLVKSGSPTVLKGMIKANFGKITIGDFILQN